jgi:cytoskeleton protein RodZ
MAFLGATDTYMKSVTAELKNERERRNIPLEQIAQETRISLRHLQSLEEGRYSDMPGGIYTRAFIKAYCEILNLDHQDILQKYEAELSPHPEKPAKSQSYIPQRKSFFWSNPIFAWSLMLIISATGLFFSRDWISSVFSPYFSQTPPALLKHETAAEPKIMPVHRSEQLDVISTSNLAPSDVPISPASNPESTGPNLETVSTSDPSSSLRLEFEVTEKCWVSVESDKGRVIRRVLEPGEAQSFDAAEHFFIVIGNAGGVHLRINGLPAKPLGKPGEVVKMLINSKSLPDLIKQTTG